MPERLVAAFTLGGGALNKMVPAVKPTQPATKLVALKKPAKKLIALKKTCNKIGCFEKNCNKTSTTEIVVHGYKKYIVVSLYGIIEMTY